MIQTIATYSESNLDLSIHIPGYYNDMQVNVLKYLDEKMNENLLQLSTSKKPSYYFVTLSLENAEKLWDHVINSRKEFFS